MGELPEFTGIFAEVGEERCVGLQGFVILQEIRSKI